MTVLTPPSTTAPVVERELTANQRNLVDTCFEEGNYDAAISLMDKLRHPGYKPHELQLRNLFYIALYPPQAGEDPDLKVDMMSTSPTKMSRMAAHGQKASHRPTISHSAAALRLLNAFAQTNTPASLCRALPSYERSALANDSNSRPDDEGDWDSEISRRSRRIVEARSCWEMLREGFIQPETSSAQGATTPSRARTRQSRRLTINNTSKGDGVLHEVPDVIGPQAWPLLDWILTVLEKDEQSTSCDHVRCSSLLLSQIPPSRSPSGAQWDLETSLDVVFYCLQDPLRTVLGTRLLTMLINLSSTTHVDFTIALNAISNRMSGLSLQQLRAVFSLLLDTICCLQFCIALCRTLLAGSSESKTVKPRARTAPRPLPASHRQAFPKELDDAAKPPAQSTAPSIVRKYPPISAIEIIRLVSSADSATSADTIELKFQLLCSFGRLQELGVAKDEEWYKMLQNGELSQAIEQGFGCSGSGSQEEEARAQDIKAILAVMGWYR